MTPAAVHSEPGAELLDLFDQDGPSVGGDLEPDEIIIDLFAGGGGASLGIEMATGRSPDEAVNHSASAIAIHAANHPRTNHHHSDVWEVDPVAVARGRRVGLLWASPDCTDHSKAKGGKPVSKKRRVLAHVVVRYAVAVRPRMIALENVEEFQDWGPVSRATGRRDPRRKGQSFRAFVRQLRRLGYVVEWRLLRAADYGSPTTRRRLFLIARCDGRPIRWPRPTHGKHGYPRPWRTAAECIDWSIPCPSIFLTRAEARQLRRETGIICKRPLADKTMRRLARGVWRYVIHAADPFIVTLRGTEASHVDASASPIDAPLRTISGQGQHQAIVAPALVEYHSPKREGDDRAKSLQDPLPTQTTQPRFGLIAPTLVQTGYGEREGQAPRALDLQAPLGTVVGGGAKHALVSAFLAKHYGGVVGSPMTEPVHTITTTDHNALVTAKLAAPLIVEPGQRHGRGERGGTDPLSTIVTKDRHALVAAFLCAYYGNEKDGGSLRDPMRTVTTNDRFALVTVQGVEYAIADVGMRMLRPHELAKAQGFTDGYILAAEFWDEEEGRIRPTKPEEQIEMIGNSVPPQLAAAIVRVNLVTRDRAQVAA